jgi:hypothetical protein
METAHTQQVALVNPIVRFVRGPAGRFIAHFLEMCVVMCAGGALLDFAFFQSAAVIGYPNLVQQAPALSLLVAALNYALAMFVWMLVRGHAARHNLEMSGTTIAVGILFAGAFWMGVIPTSSLTAWPSLLKLECGPQCAVMLAVMPLRSDRYSGRNGHDAQVHAALAGRHER